MGTPDKWRERHDALLTRWSTRSRRIFRDGPVDDGSYWQQPRRIVYLLKEVNVSDGEGGWDLATFLLEAERGYTWNMIAYWTYGLLNGLPSWVDVPDADQEFRRRWLRRVAVINLNKSGGGASTHGSRLQEIAERDADLLKEQLALLDPSVIVCGGTGDLAAQFLFDNSTAQRLNCGAGVYGGNNGQPLVLAVPHPQARQRGSQLYASVIDLAREVGLA